MNIPNKKWNVNEFKEYIAENSKDVFEGPRRRWLKMYYVYINDKALEKLQKSEPSTQGDLLKFQLAYTESASQRTKQAPFFMEMIEPGLACFYTSSTKEGYEKTLRKRVQRTRGMSEMWMRPVIFEKVKDFVVNKYDANIKAFLSLSSRDEEEKARVRPYVKRRIHYRGEDGLDSMQELKTWYGVSPVSIDFKIKGNVFQITHEGLFTFKTPNEQSFEIASEVMELIRSEQIKQKDTAIQLKYDVTPKLGATIEAGVIKLPTNELIQDSAEILINQFSGNFSFTDTCFAEDAVDFSATVVDRHKGSIFDLTMSDKKLVLVPRFDSTYESFLTFYRHVVEVFDRKATFQIFQ